MRRNSAALLGLMVALCACAEGGTRGSGISTAVLGNVLDVQRAATAQAASAAAADSELAGIRVAIEGTNLRDRTDAQGNFSLRGNFEGMITVVFDLPAGGGQAQIGLNVPAGGTLTLNDVNVDASSGSASSERQEVEFDAEFSAIDCAAQTLALMSRQHAADDVDVYLLRLDTSTVVDENGAPVACDALRVGEWAFVQGLVNPDGSFGHATVDLQN